MADEIIIGSQLSCANGSANYTMTVYTQATQTLQGGVVRKQTVPTSDTVIVLTGVTTPRAICVKNLDAANYIDLGPTVTGAIAPLIQLKAGESCVMPLKSGIVLRGQANTNSVIIEYLILEA